MKAVDETQKAIMLAAYKADKRARKAEDAKLERREQQRALVAKSE